MLFQGAELAEDDVLVYVGQDDAEGAGGWRRGFGGLDQPVEGVIGAGEGMVSVHRMLMRVQWLAARFSRALSMLQSSLSTAMTCEAPSRSARIASTPVPVPKIQDAASVEIQVLHSLQHHIGSGVMAGAEAHFGSEDEFVRYAGMGV